MPPRKPKPEKAAVMAAENMLQLTLRQHVIKRHPQMRFITKGEHTADHRLHGELLDHVHEEVPTEEEQGSAKG